MRLSRLSRFSWPRGPELVLLATFYGLLVGSCFGRPALADVDQLAWRYPMGPPAAHGFEFILLDAQQAPVLQIPLAVTYVFDGDGAPRNQTGTYTATPNYVSEDGRGGFGYVAALASDGTPGPPSQLRYFDSCHDIEVSADGIVGIPDLAVVLMEVRAAASSEERARAMRRFRTLLKWFSKACP